MGILDTPAFGIIACILAYKLGGIVHKRLKIAILNPMLIAISSIILFLLVFGIKYETFKIGGDAIHFFLGPATVILAVPLYRQAEMLKKHIFPILAGIFAGSLASVAGILVMAKFAGLDRKLIISLLPKSVTTPIGIELSSSNGGIISVTVVAIVITGIIGAVTAPSVVKILRLKHDISKGVAIGTASHAVGTSKAVEMGEMIGAVSGLAIGIAGIFTVFIIAVIKVFV